MQTTPFTVGLEVIAREAIIISPEVVFAFKGVLRAIEGNLATVEFKTPVRPTACVACGSKQHLLYSLNLNQVECVRKGCDHLHGFTLTTTQVTLSQIKPYKDYCAHKDQERWQEEFKKVQAELEKLKAIGKEKGYIE
jgi:hypothetical protein